MVVFGVMSYRYYVSHKVVAMWVFIVLALLFQPLFKIVLGRVTWNVIDVLVAALLIGLYVLEKSLEKKTTVSYQPLPPNDQSRIEDNEIDFKLNGRLSPQELVYIASKEDKSLTELFETHPEVLDGWGQMIGFHIIYLPLLIKRLKDKRVLQYRAPYLSNTKLENVKIGNDFLLQYLKNPADRQKIKHGFIRTVDVRRGSDGKDKAVNRFYPLASATGEPLADQLHRIGKQIASEQGNYNRYLESEKQSFDDWGGSDKRIQSETSSIGLASEEKDKSTDLFMEEVRERITKLRQRGIAEYILEQLIHPDDRLSRLVVTKDYCIVLPDYQDMEIKMEPLAKAVYLLFLKHPEGIAFKSLPDHRKELADIYTKLRPAGLTDRAMQSIEDVTNPLLNSINEKCARIRGAFVGQFDDHLARHYYIDGLRGEAKKIELPRDLVVWE